ncbi:predicted protein [Postia placenta Mad-698-R]|nr:predicted protein [Postia placenta Mad-698-R]
MEHRNDTHYDIIRHELNGHPSRIALLRQSSASTPALGSNVEPYKGFAPASLEGPNEWMDESILLEEIKVFDRDGQAAQDADVLSVQSQIGSDGKGGEPNEADAGGRASVTYEPLPAESKLDEEPVRKVLWDALEAKQKQEDPWAKCAKEVWEFEESLVEKWKEDINNLLLFSGLFSAVLTRFIVPFYVALAVTQTLIYMSAHLSVVAADAGHTAVANWLISLSAGSQSSPGPSPTTVVVAVLWFAALIISLGAASVAISISQWLHYHVNGASKASQRSVRMVILPFLEMDHAKAGELAVQSYPPAYSRRPIWNRCCRTEEWRLMRDLPPLSDWRELDNFCMQTLEDDDKIQMKMLAEADSCVMDESFLSTVVRPCLQQADVSEALPTFYKILDHRAHDHDEDNTPLWWAAEQDHQGVNMLGHMSIDMFNKVTSSNMNDKKREQKHILKLVHSLLGAIPRTMPTVCSRLMDMWAAMNLSD